MEQAVPRPGILCNRDLVQSVLAHRTAGEPAYIMKKFGAGLMIGLLAGWVVAVGATVVEHNGVYWGRLNPAGKSGYVTGYADAMQVSVGKLHNLTVAAELFHWKGAKKIIRQLGAELSVSAFKPDEVVKRLDEALLQPQIQRAGPEPRQCSS